MEDQVESLLRKRAHHRAIQTEKFADSLPDFCGGELLQELW